MKRLRRVPARDGWKITSNHGWFFLGLGTDIYMFHLSLGKFSICYEASWPKEKKTK